MTTYLATQPHVSLVVLMFSNLTNYHFPDFTRMAICLPVWRFIFIRMTIQDMSVIQPQRKQRRNKDRRGTDQGTMSTSYSSGSPSHASEVCPCPCYPMLCCIVFSISFFLTLSFFMRHGKSCGTGISRILFSALLTPYFHRSLPLLITQLLSIMMFCNFYTFSTFQYNCTYWAII